MSIEFDVGDGKAWQIMLATSQDAILHKKRGFKMRVDDAAGSICQTLTPGVADRAAQARPPRAPVALAGRASHT